MKIYALVVESGEYDGFSRDIITLTTNELYAQAWPFIGYTKTSCSYVVDEFNLDTFEDKSYLKEIMAFIDPKANPKCECGHMLKEHSTRGKKRCLHADRSGKNRGHLCSGFRLSVLVDTPPMAPPIRL